MRPVDVLVVDDERLARLGVLQALAGRPEVRLVGECADGDAAVRAIRTSRPDLVFLDVQMPGRDAFDVIEEIGADEMPRVIFVTAHDEYACRAFEVHAVDYLLKPLDPERFADALDRALLAASTSTPSDAAAVRRLLASLRGAAPAPAPAAPARLPVRENGRITFLDPGAIDWIEAAGNFVRIHAGGRVHLHRATMESMAEAFGDAFVRVRRSALVRVGAIAYCEPYGRSTWIMVLRGGSRVVSSRWFQPNLRRLFGDVG